MGNSDHQRAFIHELGHFIASELNFRIYKYDRRIEEFIISPRKGSEFSDGEVKTSKATALSYDPYNTAKEYVKTFYGCLFEILYRKIQINECLCSRIIDEFLILNYGNGLLDYQQMGNIASRPEINKYKKEWFSYITKNQIENIKNNPEFERIFELKYENYILTNENDFCYIDIEKLIPDVENFINSHSKFYKNLVETLEHIVLK
tara:strand:- start:188 stop:802 length:615 start_codon:yes stop_codon:yes gene_type:complete